MIALFQKWKYELTDNFLADVFEKILYHQMELNQEFDNEVTPYLCTYFSLMDRNHSQSLGRILRVMSLYEIQSAPLWQSLSTTLVQQRMQRYIPLKYLAESIGNFGTWNTPPKKLIEVLAPSVLKHFGSLDEDTTQLVTKALDKLQLESGHKEEQEKLVQKI